MPKLRITTKDREVFANRLSHRQYVDFYNSVEDLASKEVIVMAIFGEPEVWGTYVVSSERNLQEDDTIEWSMLASVFTMMQFPEEEITPSAPGEPWPVKQIVQEAATPEQVCLLRINRMAQRYHPHFFYLHRSTAFSEGILKDTAAHSPREAQGGFLFLGKPL